ncbi:hypothetical protein PIB30_076454 [Stylosanthes scabra]|uniref:Strictosidine synthase conserved region domain-containing protein n=1 Tax=Stylosanthes scabra TaxID=79078 RepID=A0ABU6YQU3_9FABA|nr:hypothetical protein [Stylosanthes scabra]
MAKGLMLVPLMEEFLNIWQQDGYSSPMRNKTICDSLADFSDIQATICGRPLGLGFNHQTNELYVADAYFGLVSIGPNGGVQLALLHENYIALLNSNDGSGSLYRYDPRTKQTTELLSGLAFPAGMAASNDGSFVLDLQITSKGTPGNEFWVAVNNLLGPPPPPPPPPLPPILPSAVRINDLRIISQIMLLPDEFVTQPVNEVHEFNGTIYGGSLFTSYAAVFTMI